MKHIFLTLLAIVSLSPVLTAQSESVPASPLGFIRLVAQPGEVTPLGVSMVNHPRGGGRIESVDGDKIVLNYELPDPGSIPSYLEVTDQESALVGERFDVVSISGTTVTVDTSANSYSTLQGSLPEALVGATLVYRNHVTLGQLEDWLAEGTEFAGSPFAPQADSLTLYRKGVPQMFSFDSSGRWMASGVSDATNVVIEPGAGMLFYRQPSAGELVLTVPGSVRDNDFRQNLPKGLSLLALGFPYDVSVEERGFVEANGFQTAFFLNQGDEIYIPGLNGILRPHFLEEDSDWWNLPSDYKFSPFSAIFLKKIEADNDFYSPQPY